MGTLRSFSEQGTSLEGDFFSLETFFPAAPDGWTFLPENRSALVAVNGLRQELLADREPEFGELLYLHGPPGSGKTSLARWLEIETAGVAIQANDLPINDDEPLDNDPWLICREASVLIVEDLGFLRVQAAERFRELLDVRSRQGGVTLITSNAGPALLEFRGIPAPAALRDRLLAGLAVSIEPWSTASRQRFLKEAANRANVDLSTELVRWLAEQTPGAARALLGALTQVQAMTRLYGGIVPEAQVREHFEHARADRETSGVARVAERVCREFGVTLKAVQSATRRQAIVQARHVGMYLARILTGESLDRIGAYFGRRDHATVAHACRKIESALPNDLKLAGELHRIAADLR